MKMNWCKILGHKWYFYRVGLHLAHCKRCGKIDEKKEK